MGLGLRRDYCLSIAQLSKHQFYQSLSGQEVGRQGSTITRRKDIITHEIREVNNKEVVDEIVTIKLNPDLPNGYRMITRNLQMEGYFINHKKVYRLMFFHMLLENPRKRTGRNFVTCGRVTPTEPLRMIEMDIKYLDTWNTQICFRTNYIGYIHTIRTFMGCRLCYEGHSSESMLGTSDSGIPTTSEHKSTRNCGGDKKR